MPVAAELEARIKATGAAEARRDIDSVGDAVDKAGKNAGVSGSKFGSLTSAVAGLSPVSLGAAGGITLLAGGFSKMIGLAADFEQSLANTKAATNATTEQMAAMRAEALKIGADTSKSASEAAAAMGELTRAGISVTDVVGGVARTVVQLSEATGSSVANMATLMSDAMNVFKVSASDAGATADTLAKAANASSISVDDLAQSMAAGGLVAKGAGMDIAEFSTAIGIMGNQGLKASDAGTSLKAFIAGLTPTSKDAKAAFQELGIQVFDTEGKFRSMPEILGSLSAAFANLTEKQRAETAELLFGSDGIRAFNALVPETSKGLADAATQWQAFGDQMAASNGVAEMSAERQKTLSGQLDQLMGSLETIGIELGSVFIPMMTEAAAKTTAFANAASDLAKMVPGGTDTIKSLGGAVVENVTHWGLFGKALDVGKAAINAAKDAVTGLGPPIEGLNEAQVEGTFSAQGLGNAYRELVAETVNIKQKSESAFAPVSSLGELFGKTADQLKKGVDWMKEFSGQINNLANQTTPTIQAFGEMSTKLNAAEAAAKAMVASKVPEHMTEWKARATEMIDAAGLAPDATTKLRGLLDVAAKGGEPGAKAMEAFGKAIESIEAPLATAAEADRALLKAHAETQLAMQSFPQTVGDIVKAMRSFADEFALAMERVPPSAREAMQLTETAVKIDLSKPGADAALSWAFAFQGKSPEIAGAANDAAQAAIEKLSIADLTKLLGNNATVGFATGILVSRAQVAAAAAEIGTVAIQSLGRTIRAESPSKEAMTRGGYFVSGFILPMKTMRGEVEDAASGLGQAAVTGLDTWLQALNATGRQAEIGLLNLRNEIAQLQKLLAFSEPYTATARELERLIQLNQGLERQITATQAAQKAQIALWEAQRTALQGVTAAMAEHTRAQNNTSLFGAGAAVAGVGGAAEIAARPDATFEQGQAAVQAMASFIESQRAFFKERFPAIAAEGWALFNAIYTTESAEGRELALGEFRAFTASLLAEQNAQAAALAAAAALTGENVAKAIGEATRAEAERQEYGSIGAKLMEDIRAAQEKSTPALLASIGAGMASLTRAFDALPEYVRGRVGPDMAEAVRLVTSAPGSPEALAAVAQAAARINTATQAIPRDFAKLGPQMREIAIDLWRQVDAGTLTLEQATEKWAGIQQLIPKNLRDLQPEVQAAIMAIAQNYLVAGGVIEDAVKQITRVQDEWAARTKANADMIIDDIKRIQDEWKKTQAELAPGAGRNGRPGNDIGEMRDLFQDTHVLVQNVVGGQIGAAAGGARPPRYPSGGVGPSWSVAPVVVTAPAPIVHTHLYVDSEEVAARIERRAGNEF